jgi:hypothetical protein
VPRRAHTLEHPSLSGSKPEAARPPPKNTTKRNLVLASLSTVPFTALRTSAAHVGFGSTNRLQCNSTTQNGDWNVLLLCTFSVNLNRQESRKQLPAVKVVNGEVSAVFVLSFVWGGVPEETLR